MEAFSATVDRVIYFSHENGYSVLHLRLDKPEEVSLAYKSGDGMFSDGNTAGAEDRRAAETVWPVGKIPRTRMQLMVNSYDRGLPISIKGIETYLASGAVRGIGPRLASRIVELFGEYTFNVLDYSSDRMLEVKGIGIDRMSKIMTAWGEQR